MRGFETAEFEGRVSRAQAAMRSAGLDAMFFTTEPEITQYSQVSQCNMKHFQAFYHGMLKQGIYFAPSAYEASFLSLAHTQEHIQHTLDTARSVFQTLAKQT